MGARGAGCAGSRAHVLAHLAARRASPGPTPRRLHADIHLCGTHPPQEDWNRLLSVNLESAFALSQLCHPLLKAQGGDAVVLFNSSVAGGPTALGSGVIYAMTKVGGRPM